MAQYGALTRRNAAAEPAALVTSPDATSRIVLVCEHASNFIPDAYDHLGLTPAQRLSHIAWDPGALAVALRLSALLDAPLVRATSSRLLADPNRAPDAPDLIPVHADTIDIPGNAAISPDDRQTRIETFHAPFHAALDALVAERMEMDRETVLIAIHSFTPTLQGRPRPWQAGIMQTDQPTFGRSVFEALQGQNPEMEIGWNQPYAHDEGRNYTLNYHADRNGLRGALIELRNDQIAGPAAADDWALRLARCLETATGQLPHALPAWIAGGLQTHHPHI